MMSSLRVVSGLALAGLVVLSCGDDDGAQTHGDAGGTSVNATGSSMSSATASETASATATATEGPQETEGEVACGDIESHVDFERMTADLEALHGIAAANGGNRASGLPGFDASHAWVQAELEQAGYVVETPSVDFNFAMVVSPGTLARTTPPAATFIHGEDFQEFLFTVPGDLEAPLTAVDLDLGVGNQSTSACEAEDFATFTPGHIALVQRGTCTFAAKIANAAQAGAIGVIVFNQGDTEAADRNDVHTVALFPSSLGDFATIPAMYASYSLGVELANQQGAVIRLVTDTIAEVRQSRNLIVETATGDPDEVVMFGAHLDSVPDGPGINDNGTGSVALLELARLAARCRPQRRIRFAWWAAEEFGLWGSNEYVEALSDDELGALLFYLNFDMVGSPNAAHFVYDGDGSAFGQSGPVGSELLEQFFHDDFAAAGSPLLETRFDLRSDYAAFHAAGVATGGLFTGAEGIKTPEQVEMFGGEANAPYDACYHRHCDTVDNIDGIVYERMTRSMAQALQTFGVEGIGFADARTPPSRQEILAAVAGAHGHHRGCNHAWADE